MESFATVSVNVATVSRSADATVAKFASDLERSVEKLVGADIGMLWSVTAFARGK